MESEEGDVSQPVPDNGREGETASGVLDTYMDIQAPKCLKDKNGLMNSGWKHPSILPGWGERQVPKKKHENRATDAYVAIYILSQPSVTVFGASWAKCGGCLFYNPPWISPPAACPSSTWNEGRNRTTKLVEIQAPSPACLQFTLTAALLYSLGRTEGRLAGCIGFVVYLL